MKPQLVISESVTLLEEENVLIICKEGKVNTIKLEPQLVSILLMLVHSKNTIVSKDDFITSIWRDNVFVGQTALRKNIYKLRNLIKNQHLDDELSIVTFPKKGYKLLLAKHNKKEFSLKDKRKLKPQLIYVSVAAMMLLFFAFGLSSEEDVILQNPSSDLVEVISTKNK